MATDEETSMAGSDTCHPMLVESDYDSWKIRIHSDEENTREMADTQAEIILSQGLPRHIFNTLNQTSTAKEIWENVELLMQGSGRTPQQRKEDLFDEYEHFHAIGNESIHDYFVRFHKLNMDISSKSYVDIYTHLKAYEPHAKKTLLKLEQSSSLADPLAYVAHTNTTTAKPPPSTPTKEKGATLDAEAEAFLTDVECTAPYDEPLAMITTNMF
nr:hypothetical protein [Tanacetum cinerariifolium]